MVATRHVAWFSLALACACSTKPQGSSETAAATPQPSPTPSANAQQASGKSPAASAAPASAPAGSPAATSIAAPPNAPAPSVPSTSTPASAPQAGTTVQTAPAAGTTANLSNPASVTAFAGTGNCTPANYGLPTTPAPITAPTGFAASGSLASLPALTVTATPVELKAFVKTVYETYPVFSQTYQGQLGLTEVQALAFMFADMSRESAANNVWQINLLTGQGSAGQAWGPFQAAVTNFTGGGYDSGIEDFTGLPIPNISNFEDPATSTYAGMKRLADGIYNSIKVFGKGQAPEMYLLGTLADHNTGYPQSATDASWLASYGYSVLSQMQGYLYTGANLSNSYVTYTGETTASLCP